MNPFWHGGGKDRTVLTIALALFALGLFVGAAGQRWADGPAVDYFHDRYAECVAAGQCH